MQCTTPNYFESMRNAASSLPARNRSITAFGSCITMSPYAGGCLPMTSMRTRNKNRVTKPKGRLDRLKPAFLRAEAKQLRDRARAMADPTAVREVLLLAQALDNLATETDGKSTNGHT